MIVLKSGDQPIGTIDLYDFDPIHSRAGVGILIDNNFRQKGLGEEALTLIQDYTFRFLMMKQLYAFVPERNTASVRLFEKCGYVKAGTLQSWIKNNDHWENVFLMQLIQA